MIPSIGLFRARTDRLVILTIVRATGLPLVITLASAFTLVIDQEGWFLPVPLRLTFGELPVTWPLVLVVVVFAAWSMERLLSHNPSHRAIARLFSWPILASAVVVAAVRVPEETAQSAGLIVAMLLGLSATVLATLWAGRNAHELSERRLLVLSGHMLLVAIGLSVVSSLSGSSLRAVATTAIVGCTGIAGVLLFAAIGVRFIGHRPPSTSRLLPLARRPSRLEPPSVPGVLEPAVEVLSILANLLVAAAFGLIDVAVSIADALLRAMINIARNVGALAAATADTLRAAVVINARAIRAIGRYPLLVPVASLAAAWFSVHFGESVRNYVAGGDLGFLGESFVLALLITAATAGVVALTLWMPFETVFLGLVDYASRPVAWYFIVCLFFAGLLGQIGLSPYRIGPVTIGLVLIEVALGGWYLVRPRPAEPEPVDDEARELSLFGAMLRGIVRRLPSAIIGVVVGLAIFLGLLADRDLASDLRGGLASHPEPTPFHLDSRAEAAVQHWRVHVVVAGESVQSIARTEGSTPDLLRLANARNYPALATDRVEVGDALVIPALNLHAAYMDQDPYRASAAVGVAVPVQVRLRNAGSSSWIRGTVTEVRLGAPGVPVGWSTSTWLFPERPARMDQAQVGPGEIASFTFAVRVPARGEQSLRLLPVVDGVLWLEDFGIHVIVVGQ